MTNKKLFKYLGVIIIPVLILISMTILPLATIVLGEEVLLETVPIDPRDLFRGDYVILEYKINQVEGSKFFHNIEVENNWKWEAEMGRRPVYVTLKEQNGFYETDQVLLEKPKSNNLYLKGRVRYISRIYNDKTQWSENNHGDIDFVYVDYQLDKYFVPENTGLDLEVAAREGALTAKVKVFRGYSILTDIFLR